MFSTTACTSLIDAKKQNKTQCYLNGFAVDEGTEIIGFNCCIKARSNSQNVMKSDLFCVFVLMCLSFSLLVICMLVNMLYLV